MCTCTVNIQGTDITSKRNVQGTDLTHVTTFEHMYTLGMYRDRHTKPVYGTDITSKKNIQGMDIIN